MASLVLGLTSMVVPQFGCLLFHLVISCPANLLTTAICISWYLCPTLPLLILACGSLITRFWERMFIANWLGSFGLIGGIADPVSQRGGSWGRLKWRESLSIFFCKGLVAKHWCMQGLLSNLVQYLRRLTMGYRLYWPVSEYSFLNCMYLPRNSCFSAGFLPGVNLTGLFC